MPNDITEEEQVRILENIRLFSHEASQESQNIKALKEQIDSIVAEVPERDVVESLKAQLTEAKEKLKYKLLGMERYNNLMEKLADENDRKKSTDLDLSDHLVAYYANTKERQIEVDPGDAREVIVKGKLGKGKDFQMSLLS